MGWYISCFQIEVILIVPPIKVAPIERRRCKTTGLVLKRDAGIKGCRSGRRRDSPSEMTEGEQSAARRPKDLNSNARPPLFRYVSFLLSFLFEAGSYQHGKQEDSV